MADVIIITISTVPQKEHYFAGQRSASVRRGVVAIHPTQEAKCSKNGMIDGNKMRPADHSN